MAQKQTQKTQHSELLVTLSLALIVLYWGNIGMRNKIRELVAMIKMMLTRSTYFQLVIYLCIGGMSALVNILLFTILMDLKVNINISIAFPFVVATLVNYMLCRRVLFTHETRWNNTNRLLIYLSWTVFMGMFDFVTTKYVYSILSITYFAKGCSCIGGFFLNFFARKYIVFSKIRVTP